MAKNRSDIQIEPQVQTIELPESEEVALPVIEIKSGIPKDHIGLTKTGMNGMIVIHKSMAKHFKDEDWAVVADSSNKKK